MSNNVIKFPLDKRPSPASNMEEVYEAAAAAKAEHIDYITEEVLRSVMAHVMSFGYPVGDPKCMKDSFLLQEAIKGILFRSVDMHHQIHEATEQLFTTEEGIEEDAVQTE